MEIFRSLAYFFHRDGVGLAETGRIDHVINEDPVQIAANVPHLIRYGLLDQDQVEPLEQILDIQAVAGLMAKNRTDELSMFPEDGICRTAFRVVAGHGSVNSNYQG